MLEYRWSPVHDRPEFPDGGPDMFVAGNSADAKYRAGGRPAKKWLAIIDLGGIDQSRILSPWRWSGSSTASIMVSLPITLKLVRGL